MPLGRFDLRLRNDLPVLGAPVGDAWAFVDGPWPESTSGVGLRVDGSVPRSTPSVSLGLAEHPAAV